MKRPNPEYNAGARYARAHVLRMIRRMINTDLPNSRPFRLVESYLMECYRQAAKRKGGTGRK